MGELQGGVGWARSRQPLKVAALAAALVIGALSGRAQAPIAADAPRCLSEIARAEAAYAIPRGLLVSIALAESGRRDGDSGQIAPWPWSVNVLGAGRFYASEADAEDAATQLLNASQARIDVGCMQVDLYSHPDAFRTLAEAFQPAANVDYAARFLVSLEKRTRSWTTAAAAYHSFDPAVAGSYVAHVLYYWKTLGLAPPAVVAAAAASPSAPVASASPGFTIDVVPEPLDIAADFYGKRDWASAAVIYRAMLAARPDDRVALLGLGETLQDSGAYADARIYLERLVATEPGDHRAVGALLADIGLMPPSQQVVALLSAQQVAPSVPELPAQLAILRDHEGDMPGALAAAGRAVALAPDDARIRLNYASLLDRHGDRTAAAQAYTAFLALYRPDSVVATVSPAAIRQRIQYLETSTP